MPRRRPSQLHARARRPSWQHHTPAPPGLPRGSSHLAAAITRLEHQRLYPGAVTAALRAWSRTARSPRRARSGGCGCPLCHPGHPSDERGVLELALHALPARAARELRTVLDPLDEHYRTRSHPDPHVSADHPWWARRTWR
ncbi:hypothetical protein [Umezawaea beigongshangensis]|uniref:hypothetical protein n=1 Tax=Umezawaea beigongshangensis TaxID=2780383 RepID=UPI0018F1C353|nr:hypothetical protein [Umezawaea beigongshangensis]